MKTALWVVSFETAHLDTLEKAISATEQALAHAFHARPCYGALTSSKTQRRFPKESLDVLGSYRSERKRPATVLN